MKNLCPSQKVIKCLSFFSLSLLFSWGCEEILTVESIEYKTVAHTPGATALRHPLLLAGRMETHTPGATALRLPLLLEGRRIT